MPGKGLNFIEHYITCLFETTASHVLNVNVVDKLGHVATLPADMVPHLLAVFDILFAARRLPPLRDVWGWTRLLASLAPVLDPKGALKGELLVVPNTMLHILKGKAWTGIYNDVKPNNLGSALRVRADQPIPCSLQYQAVYRRRMILSFSKNSPEQCLAELCTAMERAVASVSTPT